MEKEFMKLGVRIEGLENSRELSLARTKLQEAVLWYNEGKKITGEQGRIHSQVRIKTQECELWLQVAEGTIKIKDYQ